MSCLFRFTIHVLSAHFQHDEAGMTEQHMTVPHVMMHLLIRECPSGKEAEHSRILARGPGDLHHHSSLFAHFRRTPRRSSRRRRGHVSHTTLTPLSPMCQRVDDDNRLKIHQPFHKVADSRPTAVSWWPDAGWVGQVVAMNETERLETRGVGSDVTAERLTDFAAADLQVLEVNE
mmetsp:Transcript_13338/g.31826  ORF Transcript_13338/g.31826 Transcript_13338/m.31826 type:complete len:175 (-) Transcript_13338:323-847(-)